MIKRLDEYNADYTQNSILKFINYVNREDYKDMYKKHSERINKNVKQNLKDEDLYDPSFDEDYDSENEKDIELNQDTSTNRTHTHPFGFLGSYLLFHQNI